MLAYSPCKRGVIKMTYEQLEDLFYALEIEAGAAAFHGFLCGRLSCGILEMTDLVASSSEWLALSPEQSDAADRPLTEFYQSSLINLEDLSFLFQPLLPDEDLPLAERLAAVGEWCGNYISGLAEGLDSDFEMSEEGKEALEDLAAIAQISVEFDAEGERDYTELVEYIRIAVQLIFADVHPEGDSATQPTLH